LQRVVRARVRFDAIVAAVAMDKLRGDVVEDFRVLVEREEDWRGHAHPRLPQCQT
jgi:hypothetical protein